MASIIFDRPSLNGKTSEEAIPIIDKWIADTSDKLNALAETVRSMQGGAKVDGHYIKGQPSTDAAGKIQLEIDAITEKEFLDVYGLCTKTTSIDKTDGVTTKITESDSSSSTNTITAVTTFTRNSSGETTQIQTVVTPTTGNYYYTKTAVFATTTTGKTITESYTKTAKA